MDLIDVIHANSNTLIRAGLKSVMMQSGCINSFLEVSDSRELQELISKETPHLLIVDFNQPGFFSSQDIELIRTNYPHLKILIISSDYDHSLVLSALESGVHGFLTRECDELEIIDAIRSVAAGKKFFCQKIINLVLDEKLSAEQEKNCDPAILSDRETEIVILIANGMTNKEIAAKLYISPHTVHTHRKNIMKKLGVNNASALVLYAVNTGLLSNLIAS